MSSAAPETTNTRELCPNLIWSPTNTGACTRAFSRRLFTNVPCVLPLSKTNASAAPRAN
jgi:hypothetical protein